MYAISQLIHLVFQGLYLALFVRIMMSWIPHDRHHALIELLYKVTDPILKPFQRLIPPLGMGIDISPIVAFFALSIGEELLLKLLF